MFNFATVNVYIRFPNILFFSNWCENNEIFLFGVLVLTLYLAQQLINQSNYENMVTVTHRNGIANSGRHVTGVSSQEEVDTIMILHAV